ncbi:hypothetical protein MNBD_PLANCTO02-487, partial [hydrothermal vent metagenome]
MTIDDLKMITKIEFAEILNISVRSLQRKMNRGELPTPIRIGKTLRWLRSSIEDWINKKYDDSTRQKGD